MISSYNAAIEKFGNNKDPKDEEEREMLVPCHLNKAMCLIKLKKPRDAITSCDKVGLLARMPVASKLQPAADAQL